MAETLFDKIWNQHIISDLGDGNDLIYIDRIFLHERTGSVALKSLVEDGEIESKKGPVLTTAIIAGTQAVKKTHDLIPFCHPLSINSCDISIDFNDESNLIVTCTVGIDAKTGVEMEALTGVSVASLTIYDMCKSISHEIVISDIQLLEKTGGKSDIS